MARRWVAGCALVLGGLSLVIAGCWGEGPGRVSQPPIDPSSAGKEAIKMYDTNHDGKISGAELDKCPAIKSALAQIDPSGKGEVTAEMISARVQKWIDSKLGKMSLGCRVTHNGVPLAGATVTFIPEKFLGTAIPPATGKTDQSGNAMLSSTSTSSVAPRRPA